MNVKILVVGLLVVFLWASMSISTYTNAAETSTSTTSTNASVSKNVAMSLSTNLSGGIDFGAVNMNTGNNNATGNDDAGPEGDSGNGLRNSSYFITIDTDSNINVDLCIKDETALNTSGGDWLNNGNYTWNDNTTANSTEDNETEYVFETTYVKLNTTNLGSGGRTYLRFWLDVPNLQPAGTYNNTVYFKGVENGVAC
ncbi:MAG: hypothetical protein ABIJ92_02710 [Candidatus Aenigmatarchaeota archaeon]